MGVRIAAMRIPSARPVRIVERKGIPMRLNTHSTARLYALTCLACVIWLAQSLMQAQADGSLLDWSTIVFSLCLLVVIGWCARCAVVGWNTKDGDQAATFHDAGTTKEHRR